MHLYIYKIHTNLYNLNTYLILPIMFYVFTYAKCIIKVGYLKILLKKLYT